mmetsp:Transcript_43600/g.50245  ORF Transcript_43600/g.50245 Transcript_43600/m.50245 type:complete len:84 (+) Transcript_43600:566-817(+)
MHYSDLFTFCSLITTMIYISSPLFPIVLLLFPIREIETSAPTLYFQHQKQKSKLSKTTVRNLKILNDIFFVPRSKLTSHQWHN